MSFLRHFQPKEPEKKIWPTPINPCPFDGLHGKKPGRTALHWVHQSITELCINCLRDRIDELKSESAALKTFKPEGEPQTIFSTEH